MSWAAAFVQRGECYTRLILAPCASLRTRGLLHLCQASDFCSTRGISSMPSAWLLAVWQSCFAVGSWGCMHIACPICADLSGLLAPP
jgi:hypothetical protein